MKVERRAPGPGGLRTPNGGNRGRCGEVTRQTLWGFDGCRARVRVQLFRYGTNFANGGKHLSPAM